MAALASLVLLLMFAATPALAQDAVVIRSSAPAIATGKTFVAGERLQAPPGAVVTLLYRDGRIMHVRGDGGAVTIAATAVKDTAGAVMREATQAMTGQPTSRRVLGAARGGDDFVAIWLGGCTTSACQSLEDQAEREAPLAVTISPAGQFDPFRPDYEQFAVRANVRAFLACAVAGPEIGVRAAAPFSGVIAFRPISFAATATDPSITGGAKARLIGCVASRTPVKGEIVQALQKALSTAQTPQAVSAALPQAIVTNY
jgi:hypothetical protein